VRRLFDASIGACRFCDFGLDSFIRVRVSRSSLTTLDSFLKFKKKQSLASTYILSRISVVHHAALNCIRRIFAIIVTSIVFGVPITPVGALGIFVSFGGFMAFTYAKTKKAKQPKPISNLLPLTSTDADANRA
jgi:hypothetical protein